MKKKDKLNKNIFIEKLFKIAYNQYSFKFLSEYLEDYYHEEIIFSACSNYISDGIVAGRGKEEKKDTASQDALQKIKQSGELVIGTEGTYAPFTFHDSSNKLTGFDVELSEEVAKRLGVKPVFKETQWDSLLAGLDAKRFDMVANEVGIREDRQKKYDFSKPYVSSSAALVIAKDKDKPATFADVKGLKGAQSLTSNYADIAKKNGAEIIGVEGFSQAAELLASGRVDFTINDKLSVLNYLETKKMQN